MNIEQIIRDYLPENVHMSLATSAGDTPWITELHFSYDNDLNFYFISRPSRRHSIEIENNPKIAGNIIKQHAKGEKVRGIYFEGTCERLDDVQESDPAYITYRDRLGIGPERLKEQKEENGHKFYKITVNTFYLFDELGDYDAGKYELKWK